VFLWREDGGAFRIRWFTPGREVNLCGHATLAAAHALYETGRADDREPIRFISRSGPLAASRDEKARIALDFPAKPAAPADVPAELAQQLAGAQAFLREADKLMAVFESEREVAAFAPDLAAIARADAEGLIVTAPGSGAEVDFVSRFFAPAVGVPEDPVTGSAHCVLAPYWGERLGRRAMTARQLSARGGTVGIELRGDRVVLTGGAVTTLRGELTEAAFPNAEAAPA
jgi:PhzF family phenazine biosynthesis protein